MLSSNNENSWFECFMFPSMLLSSWLLLSLESQACVEDTLHGSLHSLFSSISCVFCRYISLTQDLNCSVVQLLQACLWHEEPHILCLIILHFPSFISKASSFWSFPSFLFSSSRIIRSISWQTELDVFFLPFCVVSRSNTTCTIKSVVCQTQVKPHTTTLGS